ncbi:hypothetical protein R1sor_005191 [Riccia sorocarpa]|uniref:Uncharacterized protein n=1 Tax=Riccia sorocarpa TaxID=122646 RepID=A0ABD3HMM7_9MARC
MTWHSSNRSNDDTMRLVSDSPPVAHIEETWSEFARDPRHLRLGLASDGVSSYSIRSSTYSVWPVALMNYNIPPWLATKKGFILLVLIVARSGLVVTVGLCVGEDKNLDEPPISRSMDWWKTRWNAVQTGNIQLDESRLRRWSILHELPYWKIHHLLDHMHIEANVVKSLIKHLFGEKDNVRARRGCEEFNMHPESWMQVSDDGTKTMPSAPWVLRKEERKTLCQRISKIRLPIGFGSYLRKAFTTDKAFWQVT